MRKLFLPFSKPSITEGDIAAVGDVLRSGWITTGPKAAEFEQKFSKRDYSDAETLAAPAEIWIVELVEKTGKFKSRGEIRRLIQQGGVTLDGEKITDDKVKLAVKAGQVLKAGKLVVVKLTVL